MRAKSEEPTQTATENGLLAALRPADQERLRAVTQVVTLKQGQVLCEPADEIDHIYFPHTGMISLMAVMRDGRVVETAAIGREGAVGALAGLGLHFCQTRAVVQIPMVASRIAAPACRKLVRDSDALREVILRYTEALLGQVQITAGCNGLHAILARLARLILQTHDRVHGRRVKLTQELLSEILGVRRSSVSEAANRLQAASLIRYRRGSIEIIDRAGLEQMSCECYAAIKAQTGKLLA